MYDWRTVTDGAAFFLFLFLFYQRSHMRPKRNYTRGCGGYHIQKVTLFAKLLNCDMDCGESNIVLQLQEITN